MQATRSDAFAADSWVAGRGCRDGRCGIPADRVGLRWNWFFRLWIAALAPTKGVMMRTFFALLALSFSPAALSACYQIYSGSNQLVWQSEQPPFRMDRLSIDGEVKKMVPNGHMVIVDDRRTPCPTFDDTGSSRAAQRKSGQRNPGQ